MLVGVCVCVCVCGVCEYVCVLYGAADRGGLRTNREGQTTTCVWTKLIFLKLRLSKDEVQYVC